MLAIFDIGGPLITYAVLRSAGMGTVTSLVVSGVFPAIGVAIGIIAHRRADAIGILVLAGIAVGTVLGLIAHSARLVLVEGSVPTGVFGLICLGSLWGRRPLMFRFALEFMGPDTPKGREFDGLWQYEGFRRAFRNLTAVWGLAYLMEAAARIVIVEHTSTGIALAVSKVMPLAVTAVLAVWTVAYSLYQKRKGERLAAAMESSEVPGADPDD
ncbi:MAG TPA: VC0807 family protein [Streptosporangiaceae bacterium]|nr:VC0807 family protein [Streptosporangiaceae bacterium]